MLKLIKALKPFTGHIIIIFLVLLGQAMANLSLPDMMSKLINVGIQQNGIENAVPDAIRSGEMEKLFLFMTESDKDTVDRSYLLLDPEALSGEDYNNYLKSYPALAEGPVYMLNTDNRDEIARLNSIFGKPIVIVSYIESGAAADLFGGYGLPAGVDPFTVLAKLPDAQLNAVRQMAETRLAGMPDGIVTQSAVRYLAVEYKAIGINVDRMQTVYMLIKGGLMLLLTLASIVCAIAAGFLAARVAAAYGRDTRRKIFNKVEHYSNTEFDKFSTASLITRSTNDITQIQMMLVMMLRFVFFAPIMGIGGIIKAVGQDASMSWIIAVSVVALLVMIGVIFAIALPKFRVIQTLVDKLNLVTREMLTGLMVVRAFNNQEHEEGRFEIANIDLTQVTLFINRIIVFMMPVMMLIMNGVMLVIIWVGAHQVDIGAMQVGNMMAFMQYAVQIIMSFLMVSIVFVMMPRAAVSANRVAEVLETGSSVNDPERPLKFSGDVRGLMQFRNVGFKYPGADDYVLKDISFDIVPGKTTAVIGSTGSGKSTLVNLALRFYDVTEGEILVDNMDIREVLQHDLRERIGYIPQKASLFTGTIESNIAYGNDNRSDGDVKKAAEIAQLTEYVSASEEGLNTPISQGGANISGGQKQRVAIARAIARNPEVYIFDDSFSAIDFKTDAALRKALKPVTTDASVMIVAQRINTIMNADQIIVLEKGRVAGKGTHKELMENCQVYQELALSQLSREELN